ncbi:penicillin-binding protein [Kibdelosporangium philippinense]|uniref:Penicillin-binding protein n=2 Tax=Kibdelosporangium philippinense TaxID=211113 RepID=A0ABS8ZBA8_9PSEU|nr:transglycosylase domain-containing protein [Kibdelosporangium philippinense]MCE7005149.1 penicillin-binding protein [Kibdelosporangium philippinense]
MPPPPGVRPPGGPAGQQTARVPQGPPPDQPTDVVSPVRGGSGRNRSAPEPELLTHREFEDGYDDYDDPDSRYSEPVLTDEEARLLRRKKIWRRVRRTSYVFVALMLIGPLVAFFIAYQMVEVPNPERLADRLDKTVQITYAGGTENFATVAPKGRRTLVKCDEIPDPVKRAVFAAEDATFETNEGFDITSIMRAVWNNLKGGGGGGSTITQQYVKKATGNEDPTLTRKALELVTAYKLSNTTDKTDILCGYLNTIYFGKGAWGIVEAAKAYYGVALNQITDIQAATLAGVIQQPGRAAGDPEWVEQRWNYVMNKLVENKWMEAAKRANSVFPQMVDNKDTNAGMTPDMQFIWAQAKKELEENGISEEQINRNGYKVELTIDKAAQDAAKQAAEDVMRGQPANLRKALVAVDPTNGKVIAYYGYNEAKNGIDFGKGWYNPGSAFKPFDLVAFLHKGKGLGETFDGTSGRKFGGITIHNSENDDCGEHCSVAKAMELSINTVFADIGYNQTGLKAVAAAAIEAGIPNNIGRQNMPLEQTPDLNIVIGGGKYVATPLNMASAYATFAANGTKRSPHFVAKVTNPNDGDAVVWSGDESLSQPQQAFSKSDAAENAKIARNVTESLIPVVNNTRGGALKCIEGRQCAGKTGTHGCADTAKTSKSDNCAAWMVGYTPQISTAVWVGSDDNSALKNKQGRIIFGSGLPGEIWKKFMDSYLKGKEKKTFTKFTAIGLSPDQAKTGESKTDDSKSQTSPSQTSSGTPSSSTPSSSDPTSPTKNTKTPPTLFPTGTDRDNPNPRDNDDFGR